MENNSKFIYIVAYFDKHLHPEISNDNGVRSLENTVKDDRGAKKEDFPSGLITLY